MLIKFENGRLGNQLFQYVALRSFAPEERIYLVGMGALNLMFDGIEAKFILPQTTKLRKRLTAKLFKLAVFFSKKIPLASTLEEVTSEECNKIHRKKNFFKNFSICIHGFFQNERLLDEKVLQKLCIKKELTKKAQEFLDKRELGQENTVFMHVRRGDYLSWPSSEAPAVLPLAWYIKQMDFLRDKLDNPKFILFTDDQKYVRDHFSDLPDTFISQETEHIDFAIMSMCKHGIMSASSFSFWAATFAKRDYKKGFFIAPLFWGGHKIAKWYPKHIKTNWIDYKKV